MINLIFHNSITWSTNSVAVHATNGEAISVRDDIAFYLLKLRIAVRA